MRTRLSPLGGALAVFLQLLLAGAPSSALVLCVSDDGCASVEIALPGSPNCIEADCDDEHQAANDEHACRDFAVVAAAPAKAQSVTLAQPMLAAGWVASLPLIAPPPSQPLRAPSAAVSSAARALRSTVLQL
jgi:hypothetical protein